MTLDPRAAELCERIRRAGSGAFAGRTPAEIRRSGLELAGTWSLDDTGLGVVAHLSRADGATAAEVADALGLDVSEVGAVLEGLRRSGFVRGRGAVGAEHWTALIAGRRRSRGDAGGVLAGLLVDGPATSDSASALPPPGARGDVVVAAGVSVRIYRPADGVSRGVSGGVPGDPSPPGVVVFVHGGAWVSGTLDAYDNICESLVELAGCVVVSVDYRLAPEHPFPAAVDDTLVALRWAVDHAAELDGDPARLAVMGDSAGANLATVAATLAARAGWCTPVLQVLLYPVLDVTMASPSVTEHADAPLFSRADMAWMYEQYGGPADDWRASPLVATDLTGAPPALVVVAGVDPARDDGVRYAERLAAAGVPAVVETYATMMHGFYAFAPTLPEATAARDLVAEALRSAFGAPWDAPIGTTPGSVS